MSFSGDLYPSAGASVVMTTKGDIVRYDSARERYGIGSTNQVLSVTAGLPAWKTLTLADSVLTTAGDVLYENNTPELARLPKGSDDDVLTLASGLPSWSAPAGGGVWTLEGSETLANDTTTEIDITLSNALTSSSAKLFYVFNGAQKGSTDFHMQCNGHTASNYGSSFLSSENGGSITTTLQTETAWRTSNQFNEFWFYGFGYFQIVEDYAGNDKLVGTFRTSGEGETGAGSAKSGNYRIGNFWRTDDVSSLTSLRFFNSDGTTAFQTGTTLSLYSLSKT